MRGIVVPDALATASDLETWTGASAPGNADAILRSCTGLVLKATRNALYAVDEATGIATDPIIKKCMTDATCIQAAAWVALKIDPSAGGVVTGGIAASKKIGTAQLIYDAGGTAAVAAARTAAYTDLVPDAEAKLAQQNLLTNRVRSR